MLKVEEFGAIWLAWQIDRDVDLCGIIDRVITRADRETGPSTARKQQYSFENNLETIRQELLSMRVKVRDQAARWRKPDVIRQPYLRLCERLHMPSKLYELNFEQSGEALSMSFRKDAVFAGRKQSMFGKNIIITDNTNWTTGDIVEASLDRWQVEDHFRVSKDV